MIALSPSYFKNRKLTDIVENRTVHSLNSAELNIFETHKVAQNVNLTFSDPLLVSMVRGKKIMTLKETTSFPFLPGESVFLPSNELMEIDFPEADMHNPTQCLALVISKDKVEQTVEFLNLKGSKVSGDFWSSPNFNYRFTNDANISHLLNRLIYIFNENHPSKDVFSDLLIHELVIRILQFENLERVVNSRTNNKSAFEFVITYIKQNLTNPLSVELLSKLAYMSESKFYKMFKQEFGISPNEFIIEERLKLAETLLLHKEITVKEAYLSSGFNSFSYFSKLFKKRKKLSPTEFKSLNSRNFNN